MPTIDKPMMSMVLRYAACAIFLSLTFTVAACDMSPRHVADLAATASTNRTAGASAMDAAVRAEEVKWSQLLDMAFDKLEHGDPNALAIAGAVLDMTALTIDTQPSGPETEFKWMRVGALALAAANAAIEAKNLPMARSLVLAGAARWQHEPYWRQRPNHDAVAALILASSGERDEALRRLGSRPVLLGEAQVAYDSIRKSRP